MALGGGAGALEGLAEPFLRIDGWLHHWRGPLLEDDTDVALNSANVGA